MSYSETRGRDARKGEPLTSVPPDKLVATLGLRVPELGLVFTERGRFVKRQNEVQAGAPVTPGYGVAEFYASWLPERKGYSGLRVDFGIDDLSDKSCRRHLSLIDEAGRNFKVSVSYRIYWGVTVMRQLSTGPSVLINDLELLHAGLGVLMAHYLACLDDVVRHCLALKDQPPATDHRRARGSARLGLETPLPDHGGALAGACDPRLPCPRRPSNRLHPWQTPSGRRPYERSIVDEKTLRSGARLGTAARRGAGSACPQAAPKLRTNEAELLASGCGTSAVRSIPISALVVRKPTTGGIVTSLEVFDDAEGLIVQVFGRRKPGQPECARWRPIVEGLCGEQPSA